MASLSLTSNDYRKLDFDNITYAKPIERNNFKFIDILNCNEDALLFKTPALKVYNIIEKNNNDIYIDLIINDDNKDLFEFIANIDDHNMLNIYKNCKNWFNKVIPLDVLDDFHKPVLKIKKSGNAIFRTLLHCNKINSVKKGDFAEFYIKLDSIKIYKREFVTHWITIDYDIKNIDYEFDDNIYDDNSMFDLNLKENDVDNVDNVANKDDVDNVDNKDDVDNKEVKENKDNKDILEDMNNMNVVENVENVDKKLKLNFKYNKKKKSIKKKKKIIYANKEKIWNN